MAGPPQRQISTRGRHHDDGTYHEYYMCWKCFGRTSLCVQCLNLLMSQSSFYFSKIVVSMVSLENVFNLDVNFCSHLFPGHQRRFNRSDGRDRQSGGGRHGSTEDKIMRHNVSRL